MTASYDASILETKLNPEECKKFYESRGVDGHGEYYTSPISGRKIRPHADRFKQIKKYCDSLNNNISASVAVRNRTISSPAASSSVHDRNTSAMDAISNLNISSRTQQVKSAKTNEYEIIQKWLSNPLINPKTKQRIKVEFGKNSDYRKLYNLAYLSLKNQGKTNDEIQSLLPKDHYLYGKRIDLLFHKETLGHYNPLYDFMLEFLEASCGKNARQLGYIYPTYFDIPEFEEYEKRIFSKIIDLVANAIASYIYYLNIIFLKSYNNFGKYVEDIKKIQDDLEIAAYFVNLIGYSYLVTYSFKNDFGIDKVSQHLNDYSKKYQKNSYLIPYQFSFMESKLLQHDDIIPILMKYYEELYDVFNYREAPEKSPFENLEDKRFVTIEDPLISVINKFYENGSFEHLDLESLELPVRRFANDAEYNALKAEYEEKKAKYLEDRNIWKQKHAEYKKRHNISPSDEELKMPQAPYVMIPVIGRAEKERLYVTSLFPPNLINDEKYAALEKTYRENEHVIKMYKELIDKDLLSLLKKDKTPDLPELIDKARDYFEEHVLSDENNENNGKEKCNDNSDLFSGDNFKNDKYLLSKLQLMYRVQTKNTEGNVARTDCFYAPNMYNYIINQINKKQPLQNPVNRVPLTENDVTELMKIMNVIDPKLERPVFMKPINDKLLKLEYEDAIYKGRPYVHVFLSRKFGDFNIILQTVCYIPADVTINESHSADTTSEAFLFSIFKLFDKGMLLNTYMPPYNKNGEYTQNYMEFAEIDDPKKWHYKNRKDQLDKFAIELEKIIGYLS